MSKPKPVFSPQYHQQLVELVQAGRSANDLAKEFGLHATTVAKWVRLDRMGTPSATKLPSAKPSSGPLNAKERQELIELRLKLRQVQTERDILAKAMALFAGKSEKTSAPSTSS
jgi:transposase